MDKFFTWESMKLNWNFQTDWGGVGDQTEKSSVGVVWIIFSEQHRMSKKSLYYCRSHVCDYNIYCRYYWLL